MIKLLKHCNPVNANIKLAVPRSLGPERHGIVHRKARPLPSSCGLRHLLTGPADDYTKQAPVCMRVLATGINVAVARSPRWMQARARPGCAPARFEAGL
jgi:hypothetical protein